MFLSAMFALIAVCVGQAFAQTPSADTARKAASSSATITVNVVSDTTGSKGDSLSAAHDTTGLTADSLAAMGDTTGTKKDTVAAKKDSLEILTSNASYNTVPGFRVQILTTQNLSDAIGVKAKADSLLPGYNIYIVYDSPYYKVRVGDFRARYEANQAVPFISSHGFPSAWLVPDNVFRNPARKTN